MRWRAEYRMSSVPHPIVSGECVRTAREAMEQVQGDVRPEDQTEWSG